MADESYKFATSNMNFSFGKTFNKQDNKLNYKKKLMHKIPTKGLYHKCSI